MAAETLAGLMRLILSIGGQIEIRIAKYWQHGGYGISIDAGGCGEFPRISVQTRGDPVSQPWGD
jgi:hypothetical protein